MSNTLIDKALDGRYRQFKFKNGSVYKFDKLIFTVLVILFLAFSIAVLKYNDWDKTSHYHLVCDYEKCFNPYYNTSACGKEIPSSDLICQAEFLYRGEYGTREPWYVSGFSMIVFVALIVGVVINHLYHNRKIKLKESLGEDK